MTAALVLLAGAVLAWPVSSGRASARQRLLAAGLSGRSGDRRRRRVGVDRCRLAAAALGLGIAVMANSPLGWAVAVGCAVAADRLIRRLEPARVRRRRIARERQLALALDLLAVGLRAGLPLSAAITAVADAVGGPLAEDLTAVGALTALGADARSAWQQFVDDPLWAPTARAVARAADTGSALAATFERSAADHRDRRRQSAYAAARRASVFAMAPLGLCFLPAFICIGVVPVVIGLLSGALG